MVRKMKKKLSFRGVLLSALGAVPPKDLGMALLVLGSGFVGVKSYNKSVDVGEEQTAQRGMRRVLTGRVNSLQTRVNMLSIELDKQHKDITRLQSRLKLEKKKALESDSTQVLPNEKPTKLHRLVSWLNPFG